MQQMPQQMAMQQAMPVGVPAQGNKGGLGALAAQRQQGGQADPRMMEMFKRLQGGIPGAGQMPQGPQMGFGQGMQMGQPGGFGQMDPRAMAAMQAMQQQQMGQRVDQFGRPSATGQFAFDPGQQQRIAQAGLTPDQLAQMTPDQMAKFQGAITQADIDPRTGYPVGAQVQLGSPMRGMPTQQTQQAMMDQIRQANPMVGQPQMPVPQMPGMAAPGYMQTQRELQTPTVPGDVLVQRPLPVGAGGKGAGMPPPGMIDQLRPGVPVQRPMPLPPGLSRPMPMPLPPGLNRPMPMPLPPGVNRPMPVPMPPPGYTLPPGMGLPPGLNRPMPMPMPPKGAVNRPRPVGKPVNPRFNQIMPFLR